MSTPPTDRPHLAEGLIPPQPRRFGQSSTFASFMLLGMTVLWGTSFSLTKLWHQAAAITPPYSGKVGPTLISVMTMLAFRCGLAAIILVIFWPGLLTKPTRRAHSSGLLLGLVFWLGFAVTVYGMTIISPARSAFLINLSCLFVPPLVWVIMGQRPSGWLVVGLFFGVAGGAVLTAGKVGADALNWGDALTLVGAFLFAVLMVLLDHLGRNQKSSHFTLGYLAGTAGLSLISLALIADEEFGIGEWGDWLARFFGDPKMIGVLIAMAFVTSCSFAIMTTYQPRVGANRAALLYLMEIVFSAMFGIILGFDQLTWALVLSGALIIGGNVAVELPKWRERRARTRRARTSQAYSPT